MYDESVNTDNQLEIWKKKIENDFRLWLGALSEIPNIEFTDDEPDLYSFYQELCALRNEVRKGGRRNQEVLTRFGENLAEFQKTMSDIQNRLRETDVRKRESELLANKPRLLALIDITERMERLKERLNTSPKKRFFKNYENWQRVWNRFMEGFDITYSYLENLLKNEGIAKMKTVGKPFDASRMNAVAVEYSNKHSPHMVIEEISPGFLWGDHVIKSAEVKIAKK